MQFTDIGFAFFMAVFFPVYWFLLRDKTRLQNVWLLASNYLFYGWWNWRFLTLIIITSASSFGAAISHILRAVDCTGAPCFTVSIN